MTNGVLRACALGALLLLVDGAAAQQALIVAEETTTAVAFRSQPGRVVTFICPSSITRFRDTWGTSAYHVDSSICTAAVHAGARTAGTSAQVTIRIGAAATMLEGTASNGVTSLPYPQADATFSFIANSEPGQIDWHTTYDRVPDDFRSPITVVCPPNGNRDSLVIGTLVYRSDSAICPSAVHAGILKLETGGRVTLTLEPKRETLPASEQNGITSVRWSNWDYRSYGQPYSITPGAVVVAAPASAPAVATAPLPTAPATAARRSAPRQATARDTPQQSVAPQQAAATETSGAGRRTVALAGFTATGTAPLIVPRIIALSGFVAVGTAAEIVPRVVQTTGWTAAGTN